MEFRRPPEDFGLTQETGEAIRRLYVEQERTLLETTAAVSREAGAPVSKTRVANFVRANGWTRKISFYAKRSPFHGFSRVSLEAAKAAIKRRGDWVD